MRLSGSVRMPYNPLVGMPSQGTLLAIDYGKARTGLAVGHPLTGSAQPLEPLPSKNEDLLLEGLSKAIKTWRPEVLVVGLPLGADGLDSPMSEVVRAFADKVKQAHPELELVFQDERLTSVEAASRHQKRREQGRARAKDAAKLDSVAAALILESWMSGYVETS